MIEIPEIFLGRSLYRKTLSEFTNFSLARIYKHKALRTITEKVCTSTAAKRTKSTCQLCTSPNALTHPETLTRSPISTLREYIRRRWKRSCSSLFWCRAERGETVVCMYMYTQARETWITSIRWQISHTVEPENYSTIFLYLVCIYAL